MSKTDRDPEVYGLRVLPHGPTYRFDDYRVGGQAKRRLLMGRGDACDIQLHDDAVSDVHCLIDRDHRMRAAVRDCGSDSGTRLNGARIIEGELHEGALLSVGDTTLVAVGAHGSADRVLMAAATLKEFLDRAIETHGSVSRAAVAIGVPRSTLHDWIKRKKYKPVRPPCAPVRWAGGESA